MGHCLGSRGAMPMLLAGFEPDDVTRLDLLYRSAVTLSPATAGRHDQRLTEGMRVPRRPRAGLEGHMCAGDPRGVGRLEQHIDADSTGEVFGRPFAGRP